MGNAHLKRAVCSSVCLCLCVYVCVCLCPFHLPPDPTPPPPGNVSTVKDFFFVFACFLQRFPFCSLHFALNFHFYLFAHIWFAASAAWHGQQGASGGAGTGGGRHLLLVHGAYGFLYALFCLSCGAYWSRRRRRPWRALRTEAADYP